MTLVKDLVVTLTRDTVSTDITDGIISINGSLGSDIYTGISQYPDTGQFTITTRNASLDPHINPNVRFNTQVDITYKESPLFIGYITDVDVQYGAFKEDTIITINVTDLIGLMQRHVITQEESDYYRTNYPDGVDIFEFGSGTPGVTIYSWQDFFPGTPTPTVDAPLAKVAPKPGDVAWDIYTQLLQSSYFMLGYENPESLMFMPYIKYNSSYYDYPDVSYYFDKPPLFSSEGYASTPEGQTFPYKAILVNDGFERTINQIDISNNSIEFDGVDSYIESSASYGPYIVEASTNEWGSNRGAIGTLFSGAEDIQATYDKLAYDLLEAQSEPELDIDKIVVDTAKYWDVELRDISWRFGTYKNPVRIKYDINESLSIDKLYDVIGIQYEITADSFFTTYVVARSQINLLAAGQIAQPQIVINSLTGDTNFNFTASLIGIEPADIERVDWEIGGDYQDGSDILDNPNPTWNYDPDSPVPLDWQGPGYKAIWAIVTTTSGWKVRSNVVELEITAAVPVANFTYTVSSYGILTVTDTSFDADSWFWDFDDGTVSYDQNPPAHGFTASGTYDVSLTISNGVLTDTKIIPITISIVYIPVRWMRVEWNVVRNQTGGVWDKNVITRLNEIGLQSYGSDGLWIDKYETSGGIYKEDGTTPWTPGATQPLSNNTWNSDGLILKPLVTNGGNTETFNMGFVIEMYSAGLPKPSDYFRIAPRFDITNLYFTPRSYLLNKTYEPINVYVSENKFDWYKVGEWNFGPVTSFPPTGSYYVQGLDITVPSMPPQYDAAPDFSFPKPDNTFTQTITNNGATYNFTTSSTNTTSYSWTFGDGTSSSVQNPVKTYAESGVYTVKLIKYNQYGLVYSETTYTVNITVNATGSTPVRYLLVKNDSEAYITGGNDLIYYIANDKTYYLQFPLINSFRARTNGTLANRCDAKPISNVYNIDSSNLYWRVNNTNEVATGTLTTSPTNLSLTNSNGVAPYTWTPRPAGFDISSPYGLVVDLGTTYNDLYNFDITFNKYTYHTPTTALPVDRANKDYIIGNATNLKVYAFTGTGTPSAIYNASEWTQLGTIQFTTGNYYNVTPQTIRMTPTRTLPLSL